MNIMKFTKAVSSVSDISKDNEKNVVKKGTLYIVATPIGNLADISERARKVMSEVDFIAAEDTRNTSKLLSLYGITSKPLVCYFEHNKKKQGGYIVNRLLCGESCALVTDAGTPAISDPGQDLVRECIDAGVDISSLPGACAMVTALTLSGFDTRRFVFEGFLDSIQKKRKERIEELVDEKRTLVIYEAPHRIKNTLTDLFDIFGDRNIALCRELTKINEEVIRCDLETASELYSQKEPRGEYVLVIEGAKENTSEFFWSDMSIEEHIDFYVKNGNKKMDAIKLVAKDRKLPKNEIYKHTIK